DQLHENDSLAHARAAEQADLAAARVWCEQIDDFDAGFERLNFGFLIDEFRRRPMNRIALLGVDRAHFVDRLTNDVEHPSQGFFADGNRNTGAGVHGVHAAHQPFRTIHGNAAYGVLTQVLCDFHNQVPLLVADRRVGNFQGVVNRRQGSLGKLDIDDSAENLGDFSHAHNLKTSEYRVRAGDSWASDHFLITNAFHDHGFFYFNASAVPTISISSRVIEAWRARFICRVRLPIIFEAL